ncbi:MAG TPA: SDR family oxidoreductase [Acidobacteriaceae bacterium]|nr:SDR family oxidoreductase [Acidobacteriaceae bacterium]
MNLQLEDQVVFVAGSSRGIGRAIAAALLDEGARVVLTGRDNASLRQCESEEVAARGAERVLAICGDFSDAATIEHAFQATVKRFGRIDHLVANLGTGSGKPGWAQSDEEWRRLFELNFFASVRLTQAVLPYLLQNAAGGSILYISSIVALEATPAPLPYSAAKAALVNYSKNLARQLGSKKIRVNTIAPGNIFFEGGSWERHLSTRREQVEQMLKTEVPLERFGAPEEIASLAAWLCSSAAGFATGSCFVVDGGQTRSV